MFLLILRSIAILNNIVELIIIILICYIFLYAILAIVWRTEFVYKIITYGRPEMNYCHLAPGRKKW